MTVRSVSRATLALRPIASVGTLIGAWLLSAPPALAQGPDDIPNLNSSATVRPAEYYAGVEIRINGETTGQIVRVLIDATGLPATMTAHDLRLLRIIIDSKIGDDEEVRLADIVGLQYRYNLARQVLHLSVPDALRKPVEVRVSENAAIDAAKIAQVNGLLLNYEFYGGTGAGAFLTGQLEARAFSKIGTISTSVAGNTQSAASGSGSIRRLDTYWRYVNPASNHSYTLGDFVTSSLPWSGSYRIAGLQIQTAFALRPDIVTAALPQFSGTAALPSTVELYVNESKIYSGEVPAGPFSLRQLPQITGGDVRIVTRDISGNEQTIRGSFFYSPSLLRERLIDYSVEVGALRYGYGDKSLDYGDLAGVGTLRYGLSDNQTIEAHGELAKGFVNAGFGVNQRLGGVGVLQASASLSDLPPSEWPNFYFRIGHDEPSPNSGPVIVRKTGSFCIRAG